MEIERRRGIAGRQRDRPQRCTLQTFGEEYLTCRVKDQAPLHVLGRARSPLFVPDRCRHDASSGKRLTIFLTLFNFADKKDA